MARKKVDFNRARQDDEDRAFTFHLWLFALLLAHFTCSWRIFQTVEAAANRNVKGGRRTGSFLHFEGSFHECGNTCKFPWVYVNRKSLQQLHLQSGQVSQAHSLCFEVSHPVTRCLESEFWVRLKEMQSEKSMLSPMCSWRWCRKSQFWKKSVGGWLHCWQLCSRLQSSPGPDWVEVLLLLVGLVNWLLWVIISSDIWQSWCCVGAQQLLKVTMQTVSWGSRLMDMSLKTVRGSDWAVLCYRMITQPQQDQAERTKNDEVAAVQGSL